MLIGYARTSTVDQVAGFEAQVRDLKKLGCEEIYKEQVSSVDTRKELEKAIKYLRKGDTLVVTKLDRFARSMKHLMDLNSRIEDKGAFLKITTPDMDTSTPHGKLTFNIFGAVAEFEREVMLERQREGIARAKAQGKYKGRQPTARAKSKEVLQLKTEGVTPTEIAKRLEIGRASVYRILRDEEKC